MNTYKEYVNLLKYCYAKTDDLNDIFNCLMLKCEKCNEFKGIKGICFICKKAWHYECEIILNFCSKCKIENAITEFNTGIPDMSIINKEFKIIGEKNEMNNYNLTQIFKSLNIELTDNLIDNVPYDDTSLFHLIPSQNVNNVLELMKNNTINLSYNGLKLSSDNDNYVIQATQNIERNTLLGEIAGQVVKYPTEFCLRYTENESDKLYIETKYKTNIFKFLRESVEPNVIVHIYLINNQLHLIVSSIVDIKENDIITYNNINKLD